ncbi:MAG TPA: dephospho-CoA kinase, partial [Vicinamibacterales bacterium]
AAVVAVPLLFETGGATDYDRIVVTACAPARQVERLVERGLTEAASLQRMAAQLPTEEKTARADFVVNTDGSFEDTDRQVAELLKTVRTNGW